MKRGVGPAYSEALVADIPFEYHGRPLALTPHHVVKDAFFYHRPLCFRIANGVDDGADNYPGGRTRGTRNGVPLAGGATNQEINSLIKRMNTLFLRGRGGPGRPVHMDYNALREAMPPYLATNHDLSRASIALPFYFLQYGVCLHDFASYSVGPGQGKHNARANKKEFTVSRKLPVCKQELDAAADWARAKDMDAHYRELLRLAAKEDGRTEKQRLAELFSLPAGEFFRHYFDWLREEEE